MASEKRYNNVLAVIDDRLIPDEGAKKARGEVFTPPNLVREILFGLRKSTLKEFRDTLTNFKAKKNTEFIVKTEEYTKFIWGIAKGGKCIEESESDRIGGIPLQLWRDPNTKWLDPASGIGNFPVVAFYMLDYQLGAHSIDKSYRGDENKNKRRKHIVENMLFMIEINKGNVNASRKIFKQMVPEATPKICCTDSLKMTDEKLIDVFGVNRFDIVMGNPPFNDDLIDNPVGHAQDTELWGEFVKKSFSQFLKSETGILSFIHPARWRKPEHSLQEYFFNKQFIFLAIFNKISGDNYFNAVTRFDYYVLQNKPPSVATSVKFEDNNIATIHINKHTPFISNFGYDIWEKIISKNLEPLKVLGGGSTIKYGKNDRIINGRCPSLKPFSNVNTTAKTAKVPSGTSYKKTYIETDDSGIYVDIVCSSNEHKLLKNAKVIFSKNEVVYAFFDNGNYGLTSNAFCILVDNSNSGKQIVRFLHSKLLKYLISSVKFGNFSTAKDIFDFIPNPLLFIEGEYTSEKIYEYFNFSREQIHNIESIKDINNEDELEVKRKSHKSKTTAEGGARRSKYGRTRKARRFW